MVGAAVGLRSGLSWSTPGLILWAGGLGLLACWDAGRMVLPKRVVYVTLAVTAGWLLVAAAVGGQWGRLGDAALAGAVVEGLFAVWAVGWPGSLGFGDVRLAGLVGFGVGWVAPELVAVSVAGALVSAAAAGIVGVAVGRLAWRSRLPLGVFLAGAGVVTVAVAAR